MTRRLSSFQTLALWTTGTTYFLILVGGLVRASGAGLGYFKRDKDKGARYQEADYDPKVGPKEVPDDFKGFKNERDEYLIMREEEILGVVTK